MAKPNAQLAPASVPTAGGNPRTLTASASLVRVIAAAILLALNSIALTACAHDSAKSAGINPSQESKDMTSSETYRLSKQAEHPELTPEEVGRRVVALLLELDSTNGLTLESMIAKTRFPLKYAPLGKAYSFAVEMTDSPWYYGVDFRESASGKSVFLEYAHSGEEPPKGTPLCGLKFDALEKQLKSDGFVMRVDADEMGQPLSYTFRRGQVDAQIVLGPGIARTDSEPEHRCVGQLVISSAG